jgi:hypothetical protein
MKRITIIILMGLIMAPVQSVNSQANVPPGMDKQFTQFNAAIVAHQADNLTTHGRFLQYLTRKPGDVGPACPNDQATCPEIPGISPANLDFTVNIYTSPHGEGYECVAVYHGPQDTTWKKVINHGPETFRSHDWVEVTNAR